MQDGVFQLQRRAYEAHGEGTWSCLDQEVPVTEKDEKFPVLPIQTHPVRIEYTVEARKLDAKDAGGGESTSPISRWSSTAHSMQDYNKESSIQIEDISIVARKQI